MDDEDVVGDDEYPDEFSDGSEVEEFRTDEEGEAKVTRGEEKQHEGEVSLPPFGDSRGSVFRMMEEEVLNIHKKNICGIRTTQNGSCLLVSGNDNNVRVYEFRHMNKQQKGCTKMISFSEGSTIQCIDVTSNFILAANGYKCYIYNNKCEFVKNTIRGDMYITDVNKTKGHMRQVNCCKFHPSNGHLFASGSLDSTVRLWDLKKNNSYGIDNELVHHQCLKIVNERNIMHNNILCCDFCKDGNTIIIGCENGQIDVRNKISNDYLYSLKSDRTGRKKEFPHRDAIIDILTSKKMDHYFFTRSLDATIKHWDRRNLDVPITTLKEIDTICSKSNICFYGKEERYLIVGTQRQRITPKDGQTAPNEATLYEENVLNLMKEDEEGDTQNLKNKMNQHTSNYIKVYKGDDDMNKFLTDVASASANRITKNIHGEIKIFDITTHNFDLIYSKNYEDTGVICAYYDDHIKHLFLGTTDGKCLVYYDNDSKHGILDYLNRQTKRKEEDTSFYVNSQHICNLDNLPNEIEITHSGNVLIKKPISKKPKLNPTSKVLNANAYERKRHVDPYAQYIVDSREGGHKQSREAGVGKDEEEAEEDEEEEEDIVANLRRRELEKRGKEDYFMRAYKETQPNKIIDYAAGEEQGYAEMLKMPKCPQCGVKNCVCGYMQGRKQARKG
ncbi:WD repeat-containing protein 70, putative [Plasmodium ovale]|uniref:WD repeat-containing protein 70, putative n=1 Tax=Plasmodium ovale TaxID=36330 RepID=A0A1C3KPZ4_PLAOA|nr:WD repeat-containing protein 70, putative [Plasmodium ovale]